jgi:hypothetical protein
MNNREKLLLFAFFLLIILALLLFIKKQKNISSIINHFQPFDSTSAPLNTSTQGKLILTNTPTPIPPVPYPLDPGKQIYGISRGQGSKGPDVKEATFDPLDIKKGEKQTISIAIGKSKKVQSVTISLKTDNKSQIHNLSLQKTNEIDEIWSGSWTLDDTNNYKYQAIIEAIDETGIAHVELSFR